MYICECFRCCFFYITVHIHISVPCPDIYEISHLMRCAKVSEIFKLNVFDFNVGLFGIFFFFFFSPPQN